MIAEQKKWYEAFFEGDYYRMYSARSVLRVPEVTSRQVEFIVESLQLAPGARVLDLACGHGRIAVPLAQRGYDVTGVDLSAFHLRLARQAAKRTASTCAGSTPTCETSPSRRSSTR